MSDDDWVPAFPGQRPPFKKGHDLAAKPGNLRALKSGAFSPRIVGPLAAQIKADLLALENWAFLRDPGYGAALDSCCEIQARVLLLRRHVDGMDLEEAMDSKGGRTPALEQLRQWETTAANARKDLGLTPMARARLGRDIAQSAPQLDTALVMAELRRAEQAEEAERERRTTGEGTS